MAFDDGLRRSSIQVFTISLALMTFEITLVRLFSFVMLFHMAFFALAIALFGIGLGGLYAQLFVVGKGGVSPRRVAWVRDLAPLGVALSVVVALFILMRYPYSVEFNQEQVPGPKWLALIFLAASSPFFFGSLFLSITFSQRAQQANSLYFWDLVGASLGCLAAIVALDWLGGLTTPFVVAAVCGVVTLISTMPAWARALGAAVFVLGLGAAVVNHVRPFVPDGVDPKLHLLFDEWNTFSRITVEDAPWYRGWLPNPNYTGSYPGHHILKQDNRAPAFLVNYDGNPASVEYLKYDLTSLPHRIVDPTSVAIIGAGGGRDMLTAHLYGAEKIVGVELNPTTAREAVGKVFRDYTGNAYNLPGAHVVVSNGRTFAARDDDIYDLVMTSLADTQTAGSQGAYILSENHLYTVEAFKRYWDRLNANGVCALVTSTGWGDHALKRFVTTAAQALEELGFDPATHMLVVVSGSWAPQPGACIMFSKQPVEGPLLARAHDAADDMDYVVGWPSGEEENRWSGLLRGLILNEHGERFTSEGIVDPSPIYDSRPYFFYPISGSTFLRLLIRPSLGEGEMFEHMIAFHFLVDLFFVASLLVLALILSPLVLQRGRHGRITRARGPFLLIFFSLGAGYVIVQLSVLQHFFLLLGNPITTFAITLSIMLAFTGVGSWLSRNVESSRLRHFITVAAIGVIIVQLVLLIALPGMVHVGQGWPMGLKLLLVTAVLGVLVIPMGMLFPSSIRLADSLRLDMTSWSWGMNGIGSVLGSVGSTIISLNFGVQITFAVGLMFYALVMLGARGVATRGLAESDDSESDGIGRRPLEPATRSADAAIGSAR